MSEIVCYDSKGNVMEKLYQWDTGQSIRISGADTSPTTQVHFCNRLSKSTLVLTPTVSNSNFIVSIPNILLQQPETIVVFLYQYTNPNSYRTTWSFQIPVIPKPKPDDYIYEDNVPGGGGGYSLPVATSTTLGGVMPVTRDSTTMTQSVGVDGNGRLWTAPTSGGGSSGGNTYYGTCNTGASTRVKAVTCSGFSLTSGKIIFVKFSNAQTYQATASAPIRLNVNSTGEQNIMIYGTTFAPQNSWVAGEVVGFVYDGTNYVMIGGNAINGNGVSY